MIRIRCLSVPLAFLVFFYSCAIKSPKVIHDKTQAKSENDPRSKKDYPGKHPDFEEIGSRDVGAGFNFYSIEKEIAIGKQIADEVEKYSRVIDDPIVSEYVSRIGQNLVRSSDARVPFTIKVLDNPEVNAFALPGGFFFVNSGLILNVSEESELAGVMAHEIAHVTARHGMKQATKGQLASIAMIPLIFMGGWTGYAIYQGANFGIPLSFLRMSRSAEEEADELGLQYLWQSGYDPQSIPSVFEKLASLEKRKKGTLAKVFSTHPANESRIKSTQSLINFLPPRGEYVSSTSEFDDVRQRLEKLNKEWRSKDKHKNDNKPTLMKKDGSVILPDDPAADPNEEDKPPVLKRK